MNISVMYKRYTQLTWQQQLGNLASTLARISSQAALPESDKLVVTSLREAALLIEWSSPNVPSDFLLELAAMQRELLAWHRCWPLDEARSLLSLHTRNQANRLLQRAGLLELKQQDTEVLATSVI